jgi:hypothetical protein
MGRSGYRWCIDRIRALLTRDVIRLIISGVLGRVACRRAHTSPIWPVPGPGAEFFRAVESELGLSAVIAETWGRPPDVSVFRDQLRTRYGAVPVAFDGVR